MRTWYALGSLWRLRRSLERDASSTDYWQAGRSVATIDEVLPAADVVARLAREIEGVTPAHV